MLDDVKDILEKVSGDGDDKYEKVSDDAKDLHEKVYNSWMALTSRFCTMIIWSRFAWECFT